MRRRHALLLLLLSLLSADCTSGDSGTIQIITGGETDTFTKAPAPTTLTIASVDTSGNVSTLGSGPVSTTTIDLGSQNENTVAFIEVTGGAPANERIVFGATVPLLFGGLSGATVPVFVQRVGEFARLPGPLGDARPAPLLATVQGEYLFVAGGSTASTATTTDLYDFGGFAAVAPPPTLPIAPQSMAFVGTVGWLLASDGTGTYFDLSSNTAATIPPLTGASFADVAGGATIVGDDGVQFIVGATRTTGAPTSAVLVIDPSGSNTTYPYNGLPTWVTLSAPRLGAAATWVSGRGLVVTGGSATAPGVEIVGATTSNSSSSSSGSSGSTLTVQPTGTPLAFAPDASMFGAATTLSSGTVLLAGGLLPDASDPGLRTINLACVASCAPSPWTSALPVTLGSAQAFTMSPTEAFVVGNQPITGATRTFTATSTAVTEVPTKVPHTDATAVWSPVGSIALVGGSNLIETFVF